MRAYPVMIIGAPLAGWACMACLALVGVDENGAAFAGLAWGAFWVAFSMADRTPRGAAGRDAATRYVDALARRRYFAGAMVSSALLPIPVYMLIVALAPLRLVPVTMLTLLLVTFGSMLPAALWWLALRPIPRTDERPIIAMQWNRFEPERTNTRLSPRGSSEPGKK